MEGTKLEMSGKPPTNDPPATYKPIPETDMEEATISRPKILVKLKPTSPEADGADEKMLPKEDTKISPNSNIAISDVKISPNDKQNGDAKLDIEDSKHGFVGMGKEELMKYANDPFWVKIRWALFIAFWLLWAAMLGGAILIIYSAPKCDPPPPRTWWEKGPLVEVDLDATPQDLKAFNDKGVEGFIVDLDEDAYKELDESHTLVKLLHDAKKDGVKVIVDLEPGTSNVWFEKSAEGKDGEFGDYYIWQPQSGKDGEKQAPNNWLTPNNTSSWTFSAKRNEYYYSPLGKPHLNFRNENVTSEFSKVIKRFIDKGAAGVRIRHAASLLVDPKFENELLNPKATGSFGHTQYGFYTHSKTENLMELGGLLKHWRKVVKNDTENGPFMMREEMVNPEAFKVNNTLVVDLPVQAHLFSKPNISVLDTVYSLNYTFNIDNITWPLWKVNSSALPKDVVDIVTYLLPGSVLVKENDTISKDLMHTRNAPSIMRGTCSFHAVRNGTVLAFIRVASGNPGILVAVNPSDQKVIVNFPKDIAPLSELQDVSIQMYSSNYNETEYMRVNAKKDATAVPISPISAIVLSYVPKKEEE